MAKLLPGKFVWFELVGNDPKRAQAFYADVLGWKTVPFPMGDSTYDMIYVGDTMIGGYDTTKGGPSRWLSYVSVDDVDASAKAAAAKGGKVIEAPRDLPGVGRTARIADAQGAELALLKRTADDPVDEIPPNGRWLWNELHTSEPKTALAFYGEVVGFTHKSMDMGGGETYHVIGRGGVDRGGVSGHLAGAPPHWLPYVAVDDVDATVARARKLDAMITMGPMDIPGVGRVAVLRDPTGALLAMLKPDPRMAKP